jgi:two-component system, cell cycle sensor histidine kinase and response regulator CckA
MSCILGNGSSEGASSAPNSAAPEGDTTALKSLFRLLCVYSIYLLSVELLSSVMPLSRLVQALLRFIPFCIFLLVVGVTSRPVVKWNKPTVLMGLFLACVFILLLLGVTNRLSFFDGIPLIGARSHVGRDLQSFLMVGAVVCFLTGGYFMLEEVVLAKVQLQEQVQKLQQVEAVLAESEERFRTLVEHAPDGIYVATQGRFAYLNSTALALFGATSPDQLIGRQVLERYAPDERLNISEEIRLLEQERQTIPRSERRLLRLDGTAIDVAASAAPFVFKEQNGALVFFCDITERKRLEDQLRQAQKMEAVGQLAGGVAHDFNNTMTVIEGHCSLLLAGNAGPDENRRGLEQIAQAAHRASTLTRQLLTYSRRQVMRIGPLNLNDALSQLRSMLARLLGEDIVLQFQGRADLPLIEADQGMIEQVVLNLSTNARDAMPKGGRLTLKTDLVEIDAEAAHKNPEARSGVFVCLAVSDTGCGIDEATREHLFEPFFTTKDIGKGTGLGLATVYGIVKQHKGWVEVSSVIGEGSTFSILLPIAAAPAAAPAPPQPPSSSPAELRGGRETILLVEDESSVREMLMICLRRQGYKVFEASNGVEALTLWEQHRPDIDLLFTDVRMPEGISGLELADRLREKKKTLKVIVSSGYSPDMIQLGASTSQRVTFLAKPYQLATLAQTVRRCLDEV